jgi:hypothetical protein
MVELSQCGYVSATKSIHNVKVVSEDAEIMAKENVDFMLAE